MKSTRHKWEDLKGGVQKCARCGVFRQGIHMPGKRVLEFIYWTSKGTKVLPSQGRLIPDCGGVK